jgi:hypothetical protein
MEIWEPKPPGTLWATPGLLRDFFTFTFTFIRCLTSQNTEDIQKAAEAWNQVLVRSFSRKAVMTKLMVMVIYKQQREHPTAYLQAE